MFVMNDSLATLLTLQEKDQALRLAKRELENIPAERAARQKQLAASLARFEQAKLRLREIEAEKKTIEVEVGTKEAQIEKYKTQQMQTRKNEEFTALKHEIATAEAAISQLEDRELALMMEMDSLAPKIQEAKVAYDEDKEKIEKNIAATEAKIPNLEKQIAEGQRDRDKFAEAVEESQREAYERLFRSKDGLAIVELDGDTCTGCMMSVPRQTMSDVHAGKQIVSCISCGRILFQY